MCKQSQALTQPMTISQRKLHTEGMRPNVKEQHYLGTPTYIARHIQYDQRVGRPRQT